MIVVNPKATKEITIKDAKFNVGIVPYGKRMEIESLVSGKNENMTPEVMKILMSQGAEFVRWGIKGHSGVKFTDGSDVPFKSKKEKIGEIEYDIVSDDTMEIYGATPGLISELAAAVTDFNYLGAKETKN